MFSIMTTPPSGHKAANVWIFFAARRKHKMLFRICILSYIYNFVKYLRTEYLKRLKFKKQVISDLFYKIAPLTIDNHKQLAQHPKKHNNLIPDTISPLEIFVHQKKLQTPLPSFATLIIWQHLHRAFRTYYKY